MKNNFEGLCVVEAILNSIKDIKGYKNTRKRKLLKRWKILG